MIMKLRMIIKVSQIKMKKIILIKFLMKIAMTPIPMTVIAILKIIKMNKKKKKKYL